MTFNLLLIVIMIVAVLLILIVLVQNPKGGGLSSAIAGGAGNTIGGVQSTNNFLDKATWTLAIALLVLVLFSSVAAPSEGSSSTELKNTIENRQEIVEDEVEDIDNLINQNTAPVETPTPAAE